MHKNWGKTIRYIFHLCASFSPRDTLKECIFTQKTPEIHLKQKEDIPLKKIDLASYFTPGKTLSSLTEAERDVVNQLLRMSLGKKD